MKKAVLLSVILMSVVTSNIFAVTKIDLSKAKIVLLNPASKVQANAADMLADEIEKRTRIALDVVTKMPGKGEPAFVVGIGKDVTKKMPMPAGLELPAKAEGYAIWIDTAKRSATTVCLAGVDQRNISDVANGRTVVGHVSRATVQGRVRGGRGSTGWQINSRAACAHVQLHQCKLGEDGVVVNPDGTARSPAA